MAEVMALGIFVFFFCCLETQTREKAETFSDRLFILPTNYYYQTSLFYLFACFLICLLVYSFIRLCHFKFISIPQSLTRLKVRTLCLGLFDMLIVILIVQPILVLVLLGRIRLAVSVTGFPVQLCHTTTAPSVTAKKEKLQCLLLWD